MSETYDPIVEVTDLARMRIGSPVRPPVMGTALVLERMKGEPLVVYPGQRVPQGRLGNYRRMYLVDTAHRGLSFTTRSPSADPAFPFAVTLRLGCQVVDPVAIVRDGVRDMTGALSSSLTTVIRQVTVKYDVLDPATAEAEILGLLNHVSPASTVRLSGFAVQVAPMDSAEIVTAKQELRVQGMRRDAMRPVAQGGRDEVFAQSMAMNNGDPTEWLDREQDAKDLQTMASLEALQVLMGGADSRRQEYITSEIREQAMGKFFPGAAGKGTRGGGIRDRIERKSRGAIEGGAVVDGSSAQPSAEPAVGPAANPVVEPAKQVINEPVPQPPKEPAKEPERDSRVRGSAKKPADGK
jgi:hypothetical protein